MPHRKIDSLFVTGSDTGVGKTVVSGLLGRYLSEQGYQPITQKWIETGSAGRSRDIATHVRLMRRRKSMSPFIFNLLEEHENGKQMGSLWVQLIQKRSVKFEK